MRKIISEQTISRVVRGVINEMFGEAKSLPYDPHRFDGIDSVDANTINMHLRGMIPEGNVVSKNSPYAPIRQLVLFFSDEGARRHGGRAVREIVEFMLRDDVLSSIINAITKCDIKIKDLIYGEKRLTGKPLMQQIVWNLDAILEQLEKLNAAMSSNNYRNYFSNTEAMEGSKDGKRIGLAQILIKAYMGANELKSQIKKMDVLLTKQNDPFSYNPGKFRR